MKTLRLHLCFLLIVALSTAVWAQTTATGRTPRNPAARTTTAVRSTTTTKPATAAKPAPVAKTGLILATVNGSQISQAHVDSAINNRWAAAIIRALVDDRLIRLEARRLGVKVTPTEFQKVFNEVRDGFPTEAAFQRHLHRLGLSPEAFADNLTRSLLLDKLLDRQNAVSAAEARKYYDAHLDAYTTPGKVHLFAIVTGNVEDAYLARERLAADQKFEVVAKEISIHQSKEKGGDFGWLQAGDLPDQALADQIFALADGVISAPLRSGSTYYIARVKERKPGQVVSFAEAKQAISEKLSNEKAISQEEYLRMLARKANITVAWAPVRYLSAEYRQYREVRVIVDSKPLDVEPLPYRLADGTIMVPAKPVLQAMGARLDFAGKTLTATTPNGRAKIMLGSATALVGEKDQVADMKVAPLLREGALFISPRVVVQALGARMEWSATRNALVITSLPKPPAKAAGQGTIEKQP